MENETKVQHTPEPWIVYGGHDGQFEHEPLILHERKRAQGDRGPDIAIARVIDQGSQRITDANGAMLAMAPTYKRQRDALLEALEDATLGYTAASRAYHNRTCAKDTPIPWNECTGVVCTADAQSIARARQAIAQARGEA